MCAGPLSNSVWQCVHSFVIVPSLFSRLADGITPEHLKSSFDGGSLSEDVRGEVITLEQWNILVALHGHKEDAASDNIVVAEYNSVEAMDTNLSSIEAVDGAMETPFPVLLTKKRASGFEWNPQVCQECMEARSVSPLTAFAPSRFLIEYAGGESSTSHRLQTCQDQGMSHVCFLER